MFNPPVGQGNAQGSPLAFVMHRTTGGENQQSGPVRALFRSFIHFASIGVFLTLVLVPNSATADTVFADYWLLPDYLEAHPGQAELSDAFEDRIRRPGMPPQLDQKKPVKLFVVYPGLQQSDYWRRSVDSFSRRLDELGIKYEIVERFTKPGTDLRLHGALIQEVIQTSPDYLIFTLDALRHQGMIDRVLSAGKTKIILQNITTPLRLFDGRQPFLYVGFDHLRGTELLAKEYIRRFPDGARYAVFFGPKGYVSQMRGNTFVERMDRHGSMNLRASYYVNFDRDRSYRAAMELLSQEPNLDFIYACSTDIALGILEAIDELGLNGKVLVNGWGGGSDELAALKRGELAFSVMRMNDDNGVAIAEAISLDLQQKESSVPTVYSGDIVTIDRDMSDNKLRELEARAFRYSN